MISREPTTCHSSRKSTTEVTPMMMRAQRWASSAFSVSPLSIPDVEVSATMSVPRSRCRLRLPFLPLLAPRARGAHLLFQQIPDSLPVDHEFGRVADLQRPRPRQRY